MIFTRHTIPNFAAAVFRSIKQLLRGKSFLSTGDVIDKRVATCLKCPFYDSDSGQCTACDCFVRIKALMLTESCPHEFWDAVSLDSIPFRK